MYQCNLCEKHYKHRTSLIRHKRTTHSLPGFKCPICQIEFVLTKNLKRHLRKVHSKFDCPTCDETFNSLKQLNKHAEEHRRTTQDVPLLLSTDSYKVDSALNDTVQNVSLYLENRDVGDLNLLLFDTLPLFEDMLKTLLSKGHSVHFFLYAQASLSQFDPVSETEKSVVAHFDTSNA